MNSVQDKGDSAEPIVDPLNRLIEALRLRPGMTCTEVGETLWPTMKGNRQSAARPAGALLKRAKEKGLVYEKLQSGRKFLRRTFYVNAQPTGCEDNEHSVGQMVGTKKNRS